MKFSENLKNIRRGVGLTQKSLGAKIGVTSVTIGNWERGARQPSFELLPKLADSLDTSIDTLLGKYMATGGTPAEKELLLKYRQLDTHGKKLVHIICDTELERARTRKQEIKITKTYNRYIPLYLVPPAAGVAVPLDGSDFEMILADGSVPVEADYAVRISGDSMEPYIQNGEIVFIKETHELRNGDVGVFCANGAMYCKQFYMDKKKGLHLLSANPNRASTNIYANEDSNFSIKCCGKVLLGRTIPLPDYFEED